MSNNATKLNLEIANMEDERRKLEQEAQSSNSQYIIATLGAIIGLILLLATNIWWLGLILFLAGTLAVFTQGAKKRSAQKKIDMINETIVSLTSVFRLW